MGFFTLIQAPQIPGSERRVLEEHYLETLLDPSSVLVVNYEVRFDVIEKAPTDRIIVTAPGIPQEELLALQGRVKAAMLAENPQEKFVVVNYECLIFTMPEDPIEEGTFGKVLDPAPEETKASHEESILVMRAAALIRLNQQEKDAKKADGQTDEET